MSKQERRYERIKAGLLTLVAANLTFISYTVYLINWS